MLTSGMFLDCRCRTISTAWGKEKVSVSRGGARQTDFIKVTLQSRDAVIDARRLRALEDLVTGVTPALGPEDDFVRNSHITHLENRLRSQGLRARPEQVE